MAIKIHHIKPEFVDKRGSISKVLDIEDKQYKLTAILRITHKKGSKPRGNHYHKKDYHWVYVESGKMKYFEKPFNKPKAKTISVVMKEGDLVLTSPRVIHAMKALENTVFWAITTETRDQKSYEKDTIRINII